MNGVDQINRLFETLLNVGAGVGATAAAFWLMWGAFVYMSAGGSPAPDGERARRRCGTPSSGWPSS